MNIETRKQYMETLREEYLKGNKEEKGRILDEYCKNTGQERKYTIKKFRHKVRLKETRKERKEYYDNSVKATLVDIWDIFDRPCGQRLETSIKDELDKLRKLKEIKCSDEVASKLKKMSSATIDRKLKKKELSIQDQDLTKRMIIVLWNKRIQLMSENLLVT